MFYKYCSFVNRLTPTSQMAAYSPQGLTPYQGESGPITFSSKTVKLQSATETGGQAVSRGMASSASAGDAAAGKHVGMVPNKPGYQKIMDLQKLFCKDDGKLVWMKRGARDMGPYYGSMLLMTVGLGYAFYTIYRMSMPKKSQ